MVRRCGRYSSEVGARGRGYALESRLGRERSRGRTLWIFEGARQDEGPGVVTMGVDTAFLDVVELLYSAVGCW